MTQMQQKFQEAAQKLIERYPYRAVELKALALVLEVTNFQAPGAPNDRPLPSKIPVLIGPTSTGKTVIVRELAAIMDAFLKIILLQQENPDEVAGYMVPADGERRKRIAGEAETKRDAVGSGNEDGYHLRYGKPEWFKELEITEKECRFVFLDEMDKPPRELVAPILTFIRDRTLRKWRVPPHTFLVGAMNPPRQPMDDAFIARCVFIPWDHHKEHYGYLFPSLTNAIGNFAYDGKLLLPTLPNEPDLATLHFLDEAKKHRWFWRKDVRKVIVRGMLAEAAAEIVLRTFNEIIRPPVEELIKNPELTKRIIHAMNEEDVFLLYKEMHPMFCHQDPVETLVFGEFHYWLWEEANGRRPYLYQQCMGEVPVEDHARFALHQDTWLGTVKKILNGDGTLESYEKSLIFAAQVGQRNIENPDEQVELVRKSDGSVEIKELQATGAKPDLAAASDSNN